MSIPHIVHEDSLATHQHGQNLHNCRLVPMRPILARGRWMCASLHGLVPAKPAIRHTAEANVWDVRNPVKRNTAERMTHRGDHLQVFCSMIFSYYLRSGCLPASGHSYHGLGPNIVFLNSCAVKAARNSACGHTCGCESTRPLVAVSLATELCCEPRLQQAWRRSVAGRLSAVSETPVNRRPSKHAAKPVGMYLRACRGYMDPLM